MQETVDATRRAEIVMDEAVALLTEPSVNELPTVSNCGVPPDQGAVKERDHAGQEKSAVFSIAPEALDSDGFKSDYGIRYAHAAGATYKGIATKEMVAAMGKQRRLSYLGTGGMSLEEIEHAIHYIKQAVPDGPYGMNLLHQPDDPEAEERTVDCYLKQGIQNVEAAAYISLTPAIVRYRLSGLSAGNGGCIRRHRILAKVSRPEVVTLFMRPAPEHLVKRLLESGKITQTQAELGRRVPMADDICVEADSGGHTDGGVAITLFPAILLLPDEIVAEYTSPPNIRVGAAGGIGTPHAAAAAFIMGADFILTGSINQCMVEAGTSEAAKDLLETIEAQDTAYAPAGDMFEYGAKVQVARKGLFFYTRANMLCELYTRYPSLEEIPEETIRIIEDKFFKKKISEVWSEAKAYYARSGRGEVSEI
jgi:trans-AT polyketide synthase, acyltransferase and oxidoreductase domains